MYVIIGIDGEERFPSSEILRNVEIKEQTMLRIRNAIFWYGITTALFLLAVGGIFAFIGMKMEELLFCRFADCSLFLGIYVAIGILLATGLIEIFRRCYRRYATARAEAEKRFLRRLARNQAAWERDANRNYDPL